MILPKRINSRRKGSAYERKIAKAFGKIYGELRRTPLSGGMEWKGDIQSIDGKMPFHIECKKQEKLNIWKALKQAEDDCPDDKTPIVVFARNRSKDYVVIEMDEFLEIVKKLNTSSEI